MSIFIDFFRPCCNYSTVSRRAQLTGKMQLNKQRKNNSFGI